MVSVGGKNFHIINIIQQLFSYAWIASFYESKRVVRFEEKPFKVFTHQNKIEQIPLYNDKKEKALKIAHWEEQRHNSKFDKMDFSILVISPFH